MPYVTTMAPSTEINFTSAVDLVMGISATLCYATIPNMTFGSEDLHFNTQEAGIAKSLSTTSKPIVKFSPTLYDNW